MAPRRIELAAEATAARSAVDEHPKNVSREASRQRREGEEELVEQIDVFHVDVLSAGFLRDPPPFDCRGGLRVCGSAGPLHRAGVHLPAVLVDCAYDVIRDMRLSLGDFSRGIRHLRRDPGCRCRRGGRRRAHRERPRCTIHFHGRRRLSPWLREPA